MAREAFIDELETGNKYLVRGTNLNGPFPFIEAMERGRVGKRNYIPDDGEDSLLGMDGFSGTAYQL